MRRIRREEGAVAIIVALLISVIFGITAIVVDLGLARDNVRKAQAASDAAALAAAMVLQVEGTGGQGVQDAIAEAGRYMASNLGVSSDDWTQCVSATPSCFALDAQSGRVTVAVPRDLSSPVSFGRIFGVTSIPVVASSTAVWTSGISLPGDCLLCIVGTATVSGPSSGVTTQADVTGGNVMIGQALAISPTSSMTVSGGTIAYANPAAISAPPLTVTPASGNRPGLTQMADPYVSADAPVHDPWATRALSGIDTGAWPALRVIPDPVDRSCRPSGSGQIGWLTAPDASACTSFAPNALYLLVPDPAAAPRLATWVQLAPATIGSVAFMLTCSASSNGTLIPSPCTAGTTSGAVLRGPFGTTQEVDGLDPTLSTGPLADFRGFAVIVDPNSGAVQYLGGDGHKLTIKGIVYDASSGRLAVRGNVIVNGQVVAAGSLAIGQGGPRARSAQLAIAPPAWHHGATQLEPVYLASNP